MQNEDFYRELLDNLYDGVYFVDRDRRITYWNRGAERLTGYTSADSVGKCCWNTPLRHVDGEGTPLCHTACPLTATILDGQPRQADVCLHHRDGHRVPVIVRVSPIRGEGGKIVGAVEVFSDNSQTVAALSLADDLKRTSCLDPLTEIANRGYCEQALQSTLEQSRRMGWGFGLLFLDVDRFKSVNDTHGHDTGDRVLRMVAQTLAKNSRPMDVVGRWGGEEFVVGLAQISEMEMLRCAQRYRILVENSYVEGPRGKLQVTISIGASLVRSQETLEDAFQRVDALMYESKRAGRNRVSSDWAPSAAA
ncbi:MAG: diguanylate cyclase [Fimbriimonadia bacterium]|jgi:diguanylate cyclase (GGDEF)-like protein/PAS domain S-box-containing protein